MLQIGTKNVYLYLPEDEKSLFELGGEYEEKLKRWRFPKDQVKAVTTYVRNTYPEFFDEDEEDEDDESEEMVNSKPIDKRLHRAKSFSQYDEEDEDEDMSDLERSRSRSQKYKDCSRCRAPLSNKQFCTKRNLIKSRMF